MPKYIFLFVVLFFYSLASFSNGKTSNLIKEECPGLPLSDISYAGGQKFSSADQSGNKKAYCLMDNYERKGQCGKPGYTAVNPSNVFFGSKVKGSKHGFFWCVPNTDTNPENSKEGMCLNAKKYANLNSNYSHNFEWSKGQCYCSAKSGGPKTLDCADLDPVGTGSEIVDQQFDGPEIVVNGSRIVRNSETDDEQQAQNLESATANDNFTRCVDGIVATANSCKEQGARAETICNPENVQSTANTNDPESGAGTSTSQTVVDIFAGLAQAKIASKAASGAQATCFTAGLAANGARSLVADNVESCNNNTAACNDSCSPNLLTELKNRCASIIQKTPEMLMSGVDTSLEAQYFRINIGSSIEENFSSGRSSCQRGKAKSSELNNLLSGVGNALQQSMTCACQLSGTSGSTTSSIGGCNKIPNPQACETNPSIAGCELYGQMSVCTPGASYNAELCRCQTNPKAAGCPGVKTDTLLSSFAGGAIKAGAVAGPTGFGMPAGFQSSGNTGELGTGADESSAGVVSSGKATGLGNVLPSVTSGAGGGGAASGGNSGPLGEKTSSAVDGDDGLFKGILSAGRFIGNALGIKGKKAEGGTLAEKKNANARKGLRGLANQKTFASKHVTIWELMNKCVQGETCQSNVGQFISEP